MTPSSQLTIDELLEEFEFLANWEDQCRYLIELGEELPPLAAEEKADEYLVRGCQSNVWLLITVREDDGFSERPGASRRFPQDSYSPGASALPLKEGGSPHLEIRAQSDAKIVNGLVVVLLTLYQHKTPAEVLAINPKAVFEKLGLEGHLVPQRRNGLYAMVERVRQFARNLLPATKETKEQRKPVLPVVRKLETDHGDERLDVDAVRRDFPILRQMLPNGLPVIYLDSASSAQKPQVVIDREVEVYEEYYANAYRGVYRSGDRVSTELESSREKVQEFIKAERLEEVIFTSGTTMSINLVAQAWGRKFLKPGDEILLNELEHHANIVPWQFIAKACGATVKYIPLAADGRLDLNRLDEVLSNKTKLVSVTGMSNVLGTAPPVPEIVKRAKKFGALVMVDAAQSAPHMPTNVVGEGVDFLAFSGHKLYGPSGVGILWGRKELLAAMDPFLCGGHMIEQVGLNESTWNVSPAKFEAGTPPIAQAIALGTAIDYVNRHGLCAIHTHEQTLLRYAHRRLVEVPGVKIYGPSPSHKGAIVSFTMAGAAAQDLAQLLDLRGVCVRHGHHCAMPLHHHLGVPATVRASFGMYNTETEIDVLADALDFARKELHLLE